MKRRLLLAVGLITLMGCATITPTPSAPVSPTPTVSPSTALSTSPAATATPAPPSQSPSTAALVLSVQMFEQCGSEGGCAFYADLTDSQGRISTEKLDVGHKATSGPSRRLLPGAYSLTFRSSLVSDVSFNGAPPDETPDAACKATFEVSTGQTLVSARGVFRADSCEVVITAS